MNTSSRNEIISEINIEYLNQIKFLKNNFTQHFLIKLASKF